MIMVTGGLGFIGSHIARELANKGNEVLAFGLVPDSNLEFIRKIRLSDIADKIKIVQGDVRQLPIIIETARKYGVNKVVHAAAITFIPTANERPVLTVDVNVMGTLNVMETARVLNFDKVVFISSSSVYGDLKYSPVDEKHPLEPKDIYGASKLAAEKITMAYEHVYGIHATIVRLTSVYGPGDRYERAVKTFVENALTGEDMQLHGGGLQRRDFTYVLDVAKGTTLALLKKESDKEIFNLSYGKDFSIRELAEIIKEFIPDANMQTTPARQVDVPRGCLDISKARKLLGYEPKYDLKAGIHEYIKWIVNYYAPIVGLNIKNKPILQP